MDISWKNLLQEYCMKNKLSLPNYRINTQSGPQHALKFQIEVEANGERYIGDDLCSSKKQAEQSAASKACEAIIAKDPNLISAQSSTLHVTSDYLEPPPPSYSDVMKATAIEHLPAEYTDIEKYISIMVESFGGRVRKIWAPDSNGKYKFEITGSYRYCDNIRRHHRKNQIYFMVDPMTKTYYQMCHDSECFDFRSVNRSIVIKRQAFTKEKENNV